MSYTRQDLVDFYETMLKIRFFEEKAIELYHQNTVFGNMHMYIGEEAVATGVIKNLKKTDIVVSSHRCDGHLLAKGADPGKMMAELMGKETGYCRGRGGKMHLAAPEIGFMGANGIVGAGIPLAA
jgi:pyruvate dehydrogenase E1 component alpha subunit